MGGKKPLPLIIAVIAATLVFATHATAAGTINVKPHADVAASLTTVGDIADLTGFTPAEKSRIASLRFMLSPQPCADLKMNAAQVKGRLYNAGIDTTTVQLKIPSLFTLRRTCTIVSGKQLVEGGAEFLRLNPREAGGEFDVEVKSYPADITLPSGNLEIKYELENSNKKSAGAQGFKARVLLNGELKRVLSLTSYLRVLTTVASAARDIENGSIIVEDDIDLTKVELSTVRPGAITSIESLIGKQAVRSIRRGDIFTHSSVADIADINPGEEVSIIVRGEGFEISAKGKALEKGYKGEKIKVLMENSRKVLTGTVLETGKVEIAGE